MPTKMCHCGQALHYSDPKLQEFVEDMIRLTSEYMVVTVDGRSWRVPRHYIALHGLEAWKLPELGFEEVVK